MPGVFANAERNHAERVTRLAGTLGDHPPQQAAFLRTWP
jgi:hypothetical protein